MAKHPKYMTAIIYTAVQEPGTKGQFLKYHNAAKNDPASIGYFCNWARKRFPSAQYINFYSQDGNNEFKMQKQLI